MFITALFFWALWPLILFISVMTFALPILGVAVNVVAGVMLVVNLCFLVLLLVFRRNWKRQGRMDPLYIDSFYGWRRLTLQAVKPLLTIGIIWETFLTVACILLLVFQPVKLLAGTLLP